ncbi:P-loop containing nucleoside triphosphate hydrolases superfamily protein [Quillaja saponaria]|uniref:P-loop containing nucleoside triphosphate hydrolases superfamily protein n=1 Tax=Quillaja saponaria TaxID=32244 RepID=A0AAD7KV43_QUISA|nr:P-loop containing nucleoside triphosphate hydrolases superfamily protein [Quillaja saponaria]
MLSSEELDALVSVLEIAGRKFRKNKTTEETADEDITIPSLEFMGIQIYGVDEPSMTTSQSNNKISWDNIAGYDHQKRQIEDTILLALRHPEVYDGIAHKTRSKFESNTPRALLFEGPPGTGKTSCARVIANQAGVPLLYVPLEIIISKWFGESERSLGRIFSVANDFPNGAIIFLDEIDALAGARDSGTHEFSRRILSVLLQQIDGFVQKKKVILIAATNRKQDLDPALISRFNSSIIFGLPDHDARMGIIAKYAKHLTRSDIDEFAEITKGMSGRDIRDICEQAERTWASKVIRGQASIHGKEDDPPNLEEYVESVHERRKALLNI